MMATTSSSSSNTNNSTSTNNLSLAAAAAGGPLSSLLFLQQHQQQQQQQHPKLELTNKGSGGSSRSEEFCIRWRGFHGNIVDCLGGVRIDQEFVDVTLACEAGGRMQAHKLVLASCSPYFRRLLRDLSDEKHPIIILNDVDPDTLSALMTYMYRGEVYVSEDRLPAFFRTATSLQIKGIAENAALPLALPLAPHPLVTPPHPHPPHQPHQPHQSHPPHPPHQPHQPHPQPSAAPATSAPPQAATPAAGPNQQQQQHPVGDLSLLAAAATQRPLVTTPTALLRPESGNSGGGPADEAPSPCSPPPPTTKRRKTPMPRRIDVANNGFPLSNGAYKVPKLDQPGSQQPHQPHQPQQPQHPPDDDAMNLSLRSSHNNNSSSSSLPGSPGSSSRASNPSPEAHIVVPSKVSGVDYAARASLISIPKPHIAASHLQQQQQQQQQQQAASTSRPSSPLDMSLGAEDEAKSPGEDKAFEPLNGDSKDAKKTSSSSSSSSSSGNLLLPVNANTTPEQMAALLGPSWKSRQPRLCQYCQRMFSNKFNLKQHILNMHTVGRELNCEICQKKVKNKWYLRRHHVTHHGAPLKK